MKIIDDMWWLNDEQKEQLTKVAVQAGNMLSKGEEQLVTILADVLQKAHLPNRNDYAELNRTIAELRQKVLDLEEKIATLEDELYEDDDAE